MFVGVIWSLYFLKSNGLFLAAKYSLREKTSVDLNNLLKI